MACSQTVQKKRQRIEWLKEYAFCECLFSAFRDSIEKDVHSIDHSQSTLIDISDGWAFHTKLDSAARSYVASIPNSQVIDYSGKRPIIQSCLKFKDSKELDRLIKNLLAH
jgi:hypothetical protein